MSWTLLIGVVAALGLALTLAVARRLELRGMARTVQRRERAVRAGADKAQLQHPVVDLSRCLGCATCVAVCPEGDVLEIVHGQAMVVRGAHCQGISACERECPVGAITVTLSNLEERDDIPALTDELEAIGSPGLFLAGEVTAHALIKTAVEHGTAVAAEVARRQRAAEHPSEGDDVHRTAQGPRDHPLTMPSPPVPAFGRHGHRRSPGENRRRRGFVDSGGGVPRDRPRRSRRHA